MTPRTYILIALAAVIGVMALVMDAKRPKSLEKIILEKKDRYLCYECKAQFEMSGKEAFKQIRKGEAETPEYQFAKFKCPECGEVAATSEPKPE